MWKDSCTIYSLTLISFAYPAACDGCKSHSLGSSQTEGDTQLYHLSINYSVLKSSFVSFSCSFGYAEPPSHRLRIKALVAGPRLSSIRGNKYYLWCSIRMMYWSWVLPHAEKYTLCVYVDHNEYEIAYKRTLFTFLYANREQARLVQEALVQRGLKQTKVYFAMRYWHPFTEEVRWL